MGKEKESISNKIDELEKLIKKIDLLKEIGDSASQKDACCENAMEIIEELQKINSKNEDFNEEVRNYLHKNIINCCDLLLERYGNCSNKLGAKLLNIKGKSLLEMSYYEKALESLNKALEFQPSSTDEKDIKVSLSRTLFRLSKVQVESGNLEQALEYSLEGLALNSFYFWDEYYEQRDNAKNIIQLMYEDYTADISKIPKIQKVFFKLADFLEKNDYSTLGTIFDEDAGTSCSAKDVFIYDMKILELIEIYKKINKVELIKKVIDDAIMVWDVNQHSNYFFNCLDAATKADPLNVNYYIQLKIKIYEDAPQYGLKEAKKEIYNCYRQLAEGFTELKGKLLENYSGQVGYLEEQAIIQRANAEFNRYMDEHEGLFDDQDNEWNDVYITSDYSRLDEELERDITKGKEIQLDAYERILQMLKEEPSLGTKEEYDNYKNTLLESYLEFITETINDKDYFYWGEEEVYSVNIKKHEKAIHYCDRAIDLGGDLLYFLNQKETLLRRMLNVYTENIYLEKRFSAPFRQYDEIANRLIEISPNNPYYYMVKGDVNLTIAEEIINEEYREEWWRINDYSTAFFNLIPLSLVEKVPEITIALESYDQAISRDQLFFYGYKKKMILLARIGRNEEALSCCTKAFEVCKECDGLWNNKLGISFNFKEELNELVEYERYLLGKLGRFEEGIASLKKHTWYLNKDLKGSYLQSRLLQLGDAYQIASKQNPHKTELYYQLLMQVIQEIDNNQWETVWEQKRESNCSDTGQELLSLLNKLYS